MYKWEFSGRWRCRADVAVHTQVTNVAVHHEGSDGVECVGFVPHRNSCSTKKTKKHTPDLEIAEPLSRASTQNRIPSQSLENNIVDLSAPFAASQGDLSIQGLALSPPTSLRALRVSSIVCSLFAIHLLLCFRRHNSWKHSGCVTSLWPWII
jgi:hypothetical protein